MEQQKSGVKKQQTSNRLIEHTTDIAFGIHRHTLAMLKTKNARAILLIFFSMRKLNNLGQRKQQQLALEV